MMGKKLPNSLILRFLVLIYAGSVVHPHPPITRGLQVAKEKLQAAGVEVVGWEPFKHDNGWNIVVIISSLEVLID
jgi:hypothetical protein